MKKATLFVAGLALVVDLFAQQDPQFSQNTHNRLFVNPAVAGSNKSICISMLERNQWTGFEGNPETYLIGLHAPVRLLHGGVGLSISNDKLGQESTNLLKVSYACRTTIRTGDLGIGLSAGFINKKIFPGFRPIDPVDPNIPFNGASDSKFDMDIGVYYKTDQLYIGLSSSHLLPGTLQSAYFEYDVARHYYIMAGYRHALSRDWVLLPSTFIKSDAASTQVDISLLAEWSETIWGGISYRLSDAVVPMIGVYKDIGNGTMKIGYSYDVTTSRLRQYSSGSHELMVSYCFKIPKKAPFFRHKTVRWL